LCPAARAALAGTALAGRLRKAVARAAAARPAGIPQDLRDIFISFPLSAGIVSGMR
jgi:hypothetical protein